LSNFSKEFYHWLAVCYNEAQLVIRRTKNLETFGFFKIKKVNDKKVLKVTLAFLLKTQI